MSTKQTAPQGLTVNEPLLSALVPTILDFGKRDFSIGETMSRILAITKYPTRVSFGWLSEICQIDGVNIKIHVQPTNSYNLTTKIDSSIKEYNTRLQGKLKPSQALVVEQQRDDAQTLLTKISREKEGVSYITVLLQVFAPNQEELEQVTRQVQSKLAEYRMSASALVVQQEAGYFSIVPFNTVGEEIKELAANNIPVSTLGASIPFASSGISDNKGFLLGKDSRNGVLRIDNWQRGEDRTNANWAIIGPPGGGKSATMKHIMLNEWGRGTLIIIIDPEKEYVDLAQSLGQSVYDMGGTGKYNNPLQINEQPTKEDEEENREMFAAMDEENTKISALSLHIKYLRTFFKLVLEETNPLQRAYLEEALEMVYKAHGITYDTNITGLKPTDYPLLEELYYYIRDTMTKDKKYNIEALNMLHSQLRSISVGADKHLWNGYTNVDFNAQMITMDTSGLIDAGEKIKRAQFFNVMTWGWQQVLKKNPDQKMLIAADEAYLMVDKDVPETLISMRNIAKRIRKRTGGLITATQSVNDYIDPAVRQYGQELLDSPCFKLFLGADGKNLEDITNIYNLNEAERDLIARKQRGQGLLIAGSERHKVNIMIDPAELKLFGRGGGN